MKKFEKFFFWLKQHFAVRVRSFDNGQLCGCFGPICFILCVYRCGKHTAASDTIDHLKWSVNENDK